MLAPKNTTKVFFGFYSFFAEKTDYDKLLRLPIENNPSIVQATNFAVKRRQLRQTNKLKSARINQKLKTSQNFAAEKLSLHTIKKSSNY